MVKHGYNGLTWLKLCSNTKTIHFDIWSQIKYGFEEVKLSIFRHKITRSKYFYHYHESF